jgi:hypothetical protein
VFSSDNYLNSYDKLDFYGGNLFLTDSWENSKYFTSGFKMSEYFPAFTAIAGSGGATHSENFSVGVFNPTVIWSIASERTYWQYLYRYLPGYKTTQKRQHGMTFSFSFVPYVKEETDIRTGSINATNPNNLVKKEINTGLNCSAWTQPTITSIETSQGDLRNPSFYSSCGGNNEWLVRAEAAATYINVNWASFMFKGDYLPKTATLTVNNGYYLTPYSCTDWNMPLVTGWWTDPYSENMTVFDLPTCVDNFWRVSNYVVNGGLSVDYLFVSNKRYKTVLNY